ncbi:MAG: methylated-DNA--[protein]-cysteine S-methyltransferase [Candidatus Thalassarchaeaceae archaeon]|jgi:O-6-methylguanine DNA methyltransferase|nr:methylated-DNA--[protein]-cysteine S-methyltransferase [Candidatus Thalassarchaeaceae archaeon]MED5398164.1 methylated-DNA--[protein]-cysteine S-methyltransferase [Candidatus Thermoplasmatota archaeon]
MGEEVAPDIQGTAFQRRVWDEIRKIPPGETRTYKGIAEAIGNPGSYRAVANACGSNPFPISIPCHRVIRSNGAIGGYSGPGGTSGKSVLLAVEKSIHISRNT